MAERRRAQEAQAATVLAAALACLRGPKEPKEALAAAALARPTLKTMQTALHLLHLRIRGPARTKKELQHIYPVLEPGQAKEFKAAMQEWVRELGAAGQLQPDSVKYFVSAYQGSAAHRAVLLLLDLSTLALAKELGEGPHAALAEAELLRPCCSAVAGPPPQRARQAAAEVQRQLQARMDAVVAAMQRLKQLHVQAAGQMAAGQAASGAAAVALAPRLPPLFAGSQAAAKRGELVSELLAHGPSLTAQPQAVDSDSWADLLAAGKGSATAAAGAATPPPATARRLSNPAQEASNFAAEGMAADADVLTVHSMLVQRLAAAGAALKAVASHSGAAAGGAEVRAALAEAAACRESLMLSVRQELAAARVRDEQQAAAAGGMKSSLLQLLPPSLPASNPVTEGMQMSQQAAAAAEAQDACSAWSSTPDAADVRALRQSMWRQLLQPSNGSRNDDGAAAEEAAAGGSPTAAGISQEGEARSPLLPDVPAPAAGSSSSKAPRVRPLAARATGSPSLEDLTSHRISHSSRGLDGLPLLANLNGLGSPQDEELSWQPSSGMQPQRSRDQQQVSGSPCMAESCASVSIAGGSGRQRAGGSKPMRLAVSPMQSAAASFMPQRLQRSPRRQAEAVQQPGHASGNAAGTAALPSPLRPLCESLSPRAGSPVAPQQLDSDGDSSGSSKGGGSPLVQTTSWRLDAMKEAAAADAASPASGTSSRRRAASVAFTPPRRLGDSPLPELPSRRPHQPASLAVSRRADNTPVSRLQGVSGPAQPGAALHAATPAPSPVLQPVQQQQGAQPSWRQGGLEASSPGSPQLLASCLKSKPLALSPFALAPSSPLAGQQQEQPWTLAAARSPSAAAGGGELSSPRGSAGRRRSAVITTSSPRVSATSLDAPSPAVPHRLASSGAAGSRGEGASDLVSGLRAFDSPIATSLTSRPAQQASRGSGRSMGTAGKAGGSGGGLDFADLQKRLLAINKRRR